jgi:8-oxo-dGTP pyrophosphatase MutT (NUDIX family)
MDRDHFRDPGLGAAAAVEPAAGAEAGIPWRVLERRELLSLSHVRIWQDRVALHNGETIDDFCLIESPDWAAILCITAEQRVVLVRQYRHGVAQSSLELPAGALEPGEAPLAAAQRELLEETGHTARDWRKLATLAVDPSRQRARGHFFCALGAVRSAPPAPDASEEIETLLVTPEELMRRIDAGECFHGLHVAAVLTAQRRGLL